MGLILTKLIIVHEYRKVTWLGDWKSYLRATC